MTKGIIPLYKYFFMLLTLSFRVLFSYAQNDTVQLESIEVLECYKKEQQKKMSYTFDSLSYASNESTDAGNFINSNTGIYVKDYGPGSTSTLSYRGNSASHTKIYWDGISVDNAQLGLTDLSLISFGSSMNVDFLKGGNSLDQGSGGFGGLLNVSSGSEKWKGIEVNAGYSYGSFNTQSIPLDIFLGNGKIKLESNFNYISSDNDYEYVNYLEGDEVNKRENAAFQKFQFLPKLSYKINQRNNLTLSYWHLDSKREVPSAIAVPHGDASQYDLWNRAQIRYNYIGQNTSLSLSSMMGSDYMFYENKQINIQSDNTVESFKNLVDYKSKLAKNLYSETQIRADFQCVKTINYNDVKSQKLMSLYEALNFRQRRYYIRGMARIESIDSKPLMVLPGINLGYQLSKASEELWLFSNLSYNMRYPTFNEKYWQSAGNLDLENEKSTSAEIGIEQKLLPLKKRRFYDFNYTLTFYYSEVDNLIAWAPDGGIWKPQNIKAVTNKGIEVESQFSYVKKGWKTKLNLGYVYTNSTIVEEANYPEFNGKQQIYIPEHKGHFTLNVEYRSTFITYSQAFTGQVFLDSDNTEFIPYNTPARVEIGRKIKFDKLYTLLSFRINNVFNEEYHYVAHMPMPMRHYTLNLLIHFSNL